MEQWRQYHIVMIGYRLLGWGDVLSSLRIKFSISKVLHLQGLWNTGAGGVLTKNNNLELEPNLLIN